MDYKVGTDDPIIHPDKGAGAFDSESTEMSSRAEKLLYSQLQAEAWAATGPNAVRHLNHYFDESGDPLTIDLVGMIRDVPSAKTLFLLELTTAQKFAETLKPGTWQITSRRASNGYDTQRENKDWFFAVGGYSAWGKGTVNVPPFGAARQFTMDFEYKFYDRYNWDSGKSVHIGPLKITDDFMGKFQRQGLAKEFDSVGSYQVTVKWAQGSAPTITPKPTGGR
ncbi:MAG: hypothetical protein WA324_22490 [Bryobacteraceae bacterium]